MDHVAEFFGNSILITALTGWFVAQVLKVLFVLIWNKRFDIKRMVGSGGMPSSHSAFVVSLACAVGLVEGFSSTFFALSVCFALFVMYDAAGVRRAAGQQARILNKMVEQWEKGDFSVTDKRLKELLGHSPIEVIAGAILGFMIAVIRHV